VVLGAGFGGLELTTRLSEAVGDRVRVTLIDQNDSFAFGFSKLDVMFGHRSPEEVRAHYRDIVKQSVEFRQETVTSIDPSTRRVVTDVSSYDADVLVVALGADYDTAATPGLDDGGYEFYSFGGAARVREALPTFDSGVAVIAVLGGFFKCPPAPNEAALMLHEYLTRRGVRDNVDIHLITPMPMPIPISQEVSSAIIAELTSRGINYRPKTWVSHLDPATKTVHLRDGDAVPYDLFLGVPVHVAPRVVLESGLTDDGWIAVDTSTFATKFPDVYAIGDVTSAPVPRAGVIAEGEAATLADTLISRLTDGTPPAPFEGAVICYLEMGGGEVARVDVNFLAGDAPTAVYKAPTTAAAEEKREFGSSRLTRWFGYPP
jgi:sulfide:quinone oxidoreductase